jgi:hypothetical protein
MPLSSRFTAISAQNKLRLFLQYLLPSSFGRVFTQRGHFRFQPWNRPAPRCTSTGHCPVSRSTKVPAIQFFMQASARLRLIYFLHAGMQSPGEATTLERVIGPDLEDTIKNKM